MEDIPIGTFGGFVSRLVLKIFILATGVRFSYPLPNIKKSKIMANTASAKKADRQNDRHRLHNRYYAKTTRNAIRDIRNTSDKATAEKNAPKVYAMIDKLAKIGLIHKNKASNLKSGIAVYINKLA